MRHSKGNYREIRGSKQHQIEATTRLKANVTDTNENYIKLTSSPFSSVCDRRPCSHRLALFVDLLVRIIKKEILRILIRFMSQSERFGSGRQLQQLSFSSP